MECSAARNRRGYIIYNEFKSVATQKLTVSRVLPVELPARRPAGGHVDYIFDSRPPRCWTCCCRATWRWNSSTR